MLKNVLNILSQARFDPDERSYYIDFVVSGKVKNIDFGRFKVGPINQYMEDHKGDIWKYFTHRINRTSLQESGVEIQDVKDISDITIFDFLIHNSDRRNINNWATSMGRFLAFDNGLSFWNLGEIVCKHLLECPSMICGMVTIDGEFCTDFQPEKLRFCRFNRKSYERLLRVGPEVTKEERLGAQIRFLLGKEPWYVDYDMYFGPIEIGEGLDTRLDFALKHIEECKQRYGEAIFIE